MKGYRPKLTGFMFPFRIGGRSLATGSLSAPTPGRPGKATPAIKQFSKLGDPRRRKPRVK